QDRDQESRQCVTDDDDRRRPDVEARTVGDGLTDTERNSDQVTEQGHPDAERDRDRQLLLDELDHRGVAEIALAEVEGRVVADHQEETLVGRLVEAELLLKVLDEFRIEALRTAVFRRSRIDLRAALHRVSAGKIAPATGDARRGAG